MKRHLDGQANKQMGEGVGREIGEKMEIEGVEWEERGGGRRKRRR